MLTVGVTGECIKFTKKYKNFQSQIIAILLSRARWAFKAATICVAIVSVRYQLTLRDYRSFLSFVYPGWMARLS